jgi:hypothetical protein
MRFPLFCFCLFVCGSAAAQTISDTELQAGYCLGVSTSQVEEERAALESDPSLRNTPADILWILEERQKRFQDYLGAKGFTRDRSPEALRSAFERGKKDVATCEADETYKECEERCDKDYGQNTDALLDCLDRCPSPHSCDPLEKCLENFLP